MSERDIFAAALREPDAAARATFLDRACAGNADLRGRVEALLAEYAKLGDFLEAPAAGIADTASHRPDAPPEPSGTEAPASDRYVADRYKLLQRIGEGGMGEVWMAEQTEPVRRRVAVKLIKAGMDSRAVLARFEAERQALALMDHPNIAKVHDAGATPDGRPYFVMELVKGVPITKFCDEKKLTPRERLELFVPVCNAIQHAHQKGIIHRDIKPSNVLVALYDDRPVPKVIDFGVAKAAGQQLTEKTLATDFGAVVGTPEYMSPEQASFNNLDIDTRSDVYALGTLLYELLAGSPPFSRKELEKVGLLEIFRVIREQEPPRPSTKLSTADALPTLSANRGTEPAKLTRLLRGELDWIVMRALEKDRNRRYETANAFAADLQRHLAGEQVHAVPPSAGYRLRKFLRRNRAAVVTVGSVLLTLVAAVVVGVVLTIQANDARRDAVTAQGLEKQERERAEASAAENRQLADIALDRGYLSDMQLVQHAWEERKFDLARELLDANLPERTGGKDRRRFEWHLWNRRLENPVRQVALLEVSPVQRRVALSEGGAWCAVHLRNTNQISIFDTKTGEATRRFAVEALVPGKSPGQWLSPEAALSQWLSPEAALSALALSPDASLVAGGGTGPRSGAAPTKTGELKAGEVAVWEAATGREVWRARADGGTVSQIRFDRTGGRIVVAGSRNGAKLFDAKKGTELASFAGHNPPGVVAVAFDREGDRVVSLSPTRAATTAEAKWAATPPVEAKVWDAHNGKELASIPLGMARREPRAVAFRPDGKQIAVFVAAGSGDQGGNLYFLEPVTRKGVVPSRPVARFSASSLTYSPDSTRLVGAGDGGVRVWDAGGAHDELFSLEGHASRVAASAISPDGHHLYTATNGPKEPILVWDINRGQGARLLYGPTRGLAFSPDGKYLAATGQEKVRFWHARTGEIARELVSRESGVIAFRPDGKSVLVGGGAYQRSPFIDLGWISVSGPDGPPSINIWDTTTWGKVRGWDIRPGFVGKKPNEVRSAAFSPDGRRVAAALADGTLRVWDAESGREESRLDAPPQADPAREKRFDNVTFTPDGTTLVAQRLTTLYVWDVRERKLLTTVGSDRPLQGITWFALAPDGRRVVVQEQARLKVLDVGTGRELVTASGYRDAAAGVFLSGDRFVTLSQRSGGPEVVVSVRETNTWQEVLTLTSPVRPPTADTKCQLAVSPDGLRIAVADDGKIQVWDATALKR